MNDTVLTTLTTVIEEKHSDKELLEMQEIAINFCWHARPNNKLKDIIVIALVEINRELDTRELKKEAAGG